MFDQLLSQSKQVVTAVVEALHIYAGHSHQEVISCVPKIVLPTLDK